MDHRPRLMPNNIVDRVLELVNGYLKIPDRPSIGVELQEKVLRKTPYKPGELFLPIREDGSIAA
jgi:L-alanine-DL-glutamate epimerase-like enolase superfamily enzyme